MSSNLATKYNEVGVFKSTLTQVLEGDLRLNAEYYLHSNSFELSEKIETEKLSSIAHVIGFGPFKRYYIESLEYGVPLISSSEMMELKPTYEGIISKEYTKDYEKYLVTKNTILVSCSGTIGNITLVDERLNNMAISQHALRVIPNDIIDVGLLYTFFNSEFGRSLIKGKKSGAVIDELYKDDLDRIDVPIISKNYKKKLTNNILTAFTKRDEANKLISRANQLVHEYNEIPLLSVISAKFDASNQSEIRLTSLNEFTEDNRLDAHFYSAKYIIPNEILISGSVNHLRLSDVTENIFMGNRFTRNYVDHTNGIRFIGTKNIMQIRPSGIKYLSSTETENIDNLLLKSSWILLARSGSLGGTFGRVSFVHKNYEGYAGSEHIIRVCPDENKIDPGYLYAYLNCEYGYCGITQLRHGALIDEIDPSDLGKILVPTPSGPQQNEIGNLVRKAFELRAEAIKLEDEAQELLTQVLTQE
jgi:type I restriction enzyme S subunit